MLDLTARFPDSPSCSCDECKGMCARPCWPTPDEARRLIESGFASRMMLDWWSGGECDYVEIICPASLGYEQKQAPHFPLMGCTMQDSERLCELHSVGLKPIEGRSAHHRESAKTSTNRHNLIAKSWDSDKGREVVKLWQKETQGI